MKSKILNIGKYILIPAFLIIVWACVYYLGLFNKLLFPSPINIVSEFFMLFIDERFLVAVIGTSRRIIISLIISAVIGIPLGLLLGYYEKTYSFFEFTIDFLRSIPAIVLYPLIMLFLGIWDSSRIFVAVYATVLIIIVNTSYGVRYANKSYKKIAHLYRTGKKYLFWDILFYGALPFIFSGLRIAASITLIVVIMTELLIGTVHSIGFMLKDAQLLYEIPKMYALIICCGILGYALNKLFIFLEKRIVHWT